MAEIKQEISTQEPEETCVLPPVQNQDVVTDKDNQIQIIEKTLRSIEEKEKSQQYIKGRIKYYREAFTIDKEYASKLRLKRQVFKQVTQTNKQLFLVFMSTFGLNSNEYSMELIGQSLTMDVLFE